MQMTEDFVSKLATFYRWKPTEIQLIQLTANKLVDDATEKFQVNVKLTPKAFLIVSPKNDPISVKTATDKAIKFAQMIGAQLAWNIAIPDLVDTYDGLSYGVFPYFEAFTTLPMLKILMRRRVAHQLVAWLKAVAKKTVRPANEKEIEQSFVESLENFLIAPDLPENCARIAQNALQAIRAQQWKPKFVAAHNDLWSGNVLHSHEYGFVVIDWGSSLIHGYAFYDIVRVSHSYTINRFAVRKVLKEYCEVMDCTAEEARFYLISAFAYLYQHLGEWPYSRFLAIMQDSIEHLITHTD